MSSRVPWALRIACSMVSMRRWTAPRRRASSRAIVVLPTPGRPPSTISIPLRSLEVRRFARDQTLRPGHEGLKRHGGLLLLAASAHIHQAGRFFLVAEDKDVRH